jgi:hypothetical protein
MKNAECKSTDPISCIPELIPCLGSAKFSKSPKYDHFENQIMKNTHDLYPPIDSGQELKKIKSHFHPQLYHQNLLVDCYYDY